MGLIQRLRHAAAGHGRTQFLQLDFEILIGHDQHLDRAAQVAVAHRDRLIAGLFVDVAAGREVGGEGCAGVDGNAGDDPGVDAGPAHGRTGEGEQSGQ